MSDQSKPLPAMIEWALQQAIELGKDDAAAGRSVETSIEQRITIGLIQARAFESRYWAGQLHLQGLTRVHPAILALAGHLTERSHKLEQIGLYLAEHWPPVAEDFKQQPGVVLQ